MKFKVGDKVKVISLPEARTQILSHMLGQELEIAEIIEKYDRCWYGLTDPNNVSAIWYFKEECLEPVNNINPHLKVGDIVKILSSKKKKYQDIIGKYGTITSIKYNFKYPEYIDTIRVKINNCDLCDTEDGCWLFEREKDLELVQKSKRIEITKDMLDNFDKYDGYNRWVIGKKGKWELDNDSPTLINEFLNRKENNIMKLLDIYRERKQNQITEEFDKKRKQLKEKDTLYTKLLKLKEEYETRLKTEQIASDMVNMNIFNLNNYKPSEKLNEEFNNLMREEDLAYEELNKLVEEVDSQLSICETYEQKMNILKLYNIITEEGKLNV